MNKKIVLQHIALLGFLVLYVVVICVTDFGCPIRHFTGWPCPFCGMTRAWLALFTGHFVQAFVYHPLFLLGPPFIFFAVHKNTRILSRIDMKWMNICLIAAAVLFLVVYLIRLPQGIA